MSPPERRRGKPAGPPGGRRGTRPGRSEAGRTEQPRREPRADRRERPGRVERPTRTPAGRPARRTGRPAGQRPQSSHGLGGEQVEGRQAVAELLAAGRRRTIDVWIDVAAERAPILDRIVELAERRRVPVRRVTRGRLDAEARTAAPQGVLAHAEPMPEAEFDALLRGRPDGKLPFLLALDGVTDPQNLGGLLRSADGAGATGAVLPRHRAAHLTPAVAKAAAGAIEHVPVTTVAGLPSAVTRAARGGVWVVGLDPSAPNSLFDLEVADQPLLVVLGAEGKGLSPLCAKRCDALVHIPLRGVLPSLSVAAAGAVGLFEIARRRRG